ncbi:FecR family protein [Sunxiuqinia indica]|uniref:FecR family protein n=1 Tax=Sunxiuqinia indica TaxID=2692584 RepID=UPI00135A1163|nr:FecR domain-containing protein [Sunxiuqinia indica]
MEKLQIESLIIKDFSGHSTPEEKRKITNWINQSSANKKSFEAYRKLWKDSRLLTLNDKIDTELALKESKKDIPEFNRKTHWLTYWKQAAAVLVLSVFIASAFHFLTRLDQNEDEAIYQEVKAAYGTQTQLQLADGTTVWLNAGSRLSFPTSFENQQQRKVTLVGEGFFEVTKDSKHPFIVSTSRLDVRVLGTSFNVNAYENEDEITVALKEGKVSLLKTTNGSSKHVLDLDPLEVATYQRNTNKILHLKETDLDRYTAWREGLIVFFDDPIEKVVSRLGNWYNIKIEVKDKELLKEHITGTFRDNSLEQVLHLLSLMSPIDYYFVKSDENKQKVVLSRK